MVFVTVGTHEQQFDRLVKAVDRLISEGIIAEDTFIQTGYCGYEPLHCSWSKFVPASRMTELMLCADIVITHGGPSSFVEAMAAGKVPIVVPRRAEFGEHVNNHQVDFVLEVAKRQGGIIPCLNVDDLPRCLEEAEHGANGNGFRSHNLDFCAAFERVVESL